MITHVVTTLKRQATHLLDEVRKNRQPILITEYGKPAAYLVDAQSFVDTQEKLRVLEEIARGEKAIQEKRVLSHSSVRKTFQSYL